MGENPDYLRAVSLHLSRTLEEIGLNEVTVKRRRQTFLYTERLRTFYNKLKGSDTQCYHFGSQTEGATTTGLHSDLDMLSCFNEFHILYDWEEWKRGEHSLLMLQEDTAPGYCRLQLLYCNIPMGIEDLLNEHCMFDSRGRVILKNTWLNTSLPGLHMVRNGPALSEDSRPGFTDNDAVFALKCSSWPTQAGEFIRRRRRHCWPSQQLLQEAIQHGVFLVPVGYKLSPTEELEWRLSASLAERCLMFSLSTVHIQCYVVLKMLMKTFVEPCVSKCISSYHCKTALLYCTENTEQGFWRNDNLLECVIQCLSMLLIWVTDGFCPQFMISNENLFAGKVTVQNRSVLMSVLTELINSKGRVLLRVHIDDLGHRLQAKLNTEPSIMPMLDSLETVKLAGQFECIKQQYINGIMRVFDKLKKKTSIPLIRNLYHSIEMLKNLIGPSDKLEQQAITTFTRFLSSWLGSLLASFALSNKIRVPNKALGLLRIGANSDCAATLKLASVLYCSGDVQRTETILQNLEAHFCRNEMQILCMCNERPLKLSQAFCQMMHVLRGTNTPAKLFAPCVTFSSHEINCAPSALRSEMFRSVGDDIQHRHPIQDKWMDLAAVNYLPFLYYLQYMTYRRLGKCYLLTRVLYNLKRCIRENDISHLETAWNLLGQCMELEQQPEAAMACYRTSLEIRPRNNAANWHVAVLCYKTVIHNQRGQRLQSSRDSLEPSRTDNGTRAAARGCHCVLQNVATDTTQK